MSQRNIPNEFDRDMAAIRDLIDRALSVSFVDCWPFPGLPALMDPVTRHEFAMIRTQAFIEGVRLAGDLEEFRRLEVAIAASGPSGVEQRALVATRVFGAL